MDILSVINLYKNFGGLMAINGIELRVKKGERRAIIGPNGAGKTTLFNVISGELKPSSGSVFFKEKEITALPPYIISKMGISRTYQRTNIFPSMSVFENISLAVQSHTSHNLRLLKNAMCLSEINKKTLKIIEEVNLIERKNVLAKELSHGEQRKLEVGIALASEPELILFDEPTAGMSPEETSIMIDMLGVFSRDLTILIIEHDMDVIFSIADRITVLDYGEVLADGLPDEIRSNTDVQKVYLGEMK